MKKLLTLLITLSITLFGSSGMLKTDANFRQTPSLLSDKVNTLLKGSKVTVLQKIYGENGTWYKTDKGFVSAELIQIDDNNIPKKLVKDKKYFLEVSQGITIQSVKQKDISGSIILANEPDTKAIDVSWALGYYLDSQNSVGFEMQYQKYNDINYFNYLLTFNRYLNESVYVGLVTGISYIELTKSHINSSLLDKSGSQSLAYGLQLGYEYPYSKDFLTFVQYRYLKAQHVTDLLPYQTTNHSQLIRDHQSTISFGFKYIFE